MKKYMLMIMSALFALLQAGRAEPLGVGVGLGTFDGDFGAQARKDFVFGGEQQFAAVVQGGLYDQDRWTGRLDLDLHYILRPAASLSFYPLVGADWAIQHKHNRAGINIGAGGALALNSETSLFFEAKYVAGDWDGFAFTAGVNF